MTKQFLASVMVLALAATVVGVGVNADSTADVSATVTAQLVSVSITSDGVVAYGTLPLNTTKDTIALTDTQTATNNGNVTVDLGIRSSDAVGDTNWNLAASADTDVFTHEFSINSGGLWTHFSADNNTYSTLVNTVTAGNGQTFDLRIGTPTASTDSVEHTVTVTVQATLSS